MRKLLYLFTILVLANCKSQEEKNSQHSQRVVISGRVLNFDSNDMGVRFTVNRLGVSRLNMDAKMDSLGYFTTYFDSYIPTDIWIDYKTNFLVLIHPGDSIYIEFDGRPNWRPELLKTIQFSGDAAEINKEAAVFQQLYYSNSLYTDNFAKERAKIEYNVNEFRLYLDTIQQKRKNLYDQFVTDYSPSDEAKVWASTYIQTGYYDELIFYPLEHQFANQSKPGYCYVPVSYYDQLLNLLPITDSMLISGFALMSYIDRFHFGYATMNTLAEESFKQKKSKAGFISPIIQLTDSIIFFGIIKNTPDTLLRQLVLTDLFRRDFELSKVNRFEKYREVADDIIQEPFLKEPLLEMYGIVKERLVNPQLVSDAMLKKVADTSAKQIIDSILLYNRGKVVYIDCWADYCGPCRSEMPNSKKLMEYMDGKEIEFVYLCIDSKETVWKAILDKYQLGGQHYFLTKAQSSDLREAFDIDGVPYYFLVDRNGAIIDKGSHLRPDIVKERIEKLLIH